jgi:hypothetical protein
MGDTPAKIDASDLTKVHLKSSPVSLEEAEKAREKAHLEAVKAGIASEKAAEKKK